MSYLIFGFICNNNFHRIILKALRFVYGNRICNLERNDVLHRCAFFITGVWLCSINVKANFRFSSIITNIVQSITSQHFQLIEQSINLYCEIYAFS